MAEVKVSMGYTMNMGSFESMRFDYGITDTVRNYETHEDAITRVEKMVEEKLLGRIKEERGS